MSWRSEFTDQTHKKMEDLQIEIKPGKFLKNPTMKIDKVYYDVPSNSYQLEIIFSENGGNFNTSRFYEFQNDPGESLSMSQIIENLEDNPYIGKKDENGELLIPIIPQ